MECHRPSSGWEDFRRPSIDAGKEIRLLVLPPSHCPADEYRFEVATLDCRPSYEVLSYAWGDNCGGHYIRVDGRRVRVARQLADTLRALRRPGISRRLFVGTLAIDNSKQEERSQQIKLMTQILAQADGFVVPDGRADAVEDGRRSLSNL